MFEVAGRLDEAHDGRQILPPPEVRHRERPLAAPGVGFHSRQLCRTAR